jgi:hypothetical protein
MLASFGGSTPLLVPHVLAGSASTTLDLSKHYRYRVVQVLGGGYVTISAGGRVVLMGLLGVDARRIEAKEVLQSLIGGREVCIEYDPQSHADASGRPTAYLHRAIDGVLINAELISRGYAVVSNHTGPRGETLRAAEAAAEDEHRGLWAIGNLRTTHAEYSTRYHDELATTLRHIKQYKAALRAWQREYEREAMAAMMQAEAAQRAWQTQQQQQGMSELSPSEQGGTSTVRVLNPNPFMVHVRLQSQSAWREFMVPAGSVDGVIVPDGRYDVFFIFSNEPGTRYQGDPLFLASSGVTITAKPQPNGNFGLRKL